MTPNAAWFLLHEPEHNDAAPVSWATTANAARFGMTLTPIQKGAYETLDEMSDAEIIDLAVKYAAKRGRLLVCYGRQSTGSSTG
jgi:hypothetical protein